MRRLAGLIATALAITTLGACSSDGGKVASTGTSGRKGPVSFSTEAPKPYYSRGVVIANDKGRKLVLDPSLPVFEPTLTGDTVEQSNWPAAGRLLSIKELIGLFPEAYTIALTPQGPSKVQVGIKLPEATRTSTITVTITAVGSQDSILGGFDSQRRSEQSTYARDGDPGSTGYAYYHDGSFKTQRLARNKREAWTTVIGNGKTAMQLSVETADFIGLSSGLDSTDVLNGQVMPLFFQLLAARM